MYVIILRAQNMQIPANNVLGTPQYVDKHEKMKIQTIDANQNLPKIPNQTKNFKHGSTVPILSTQVCYVVFYIIPGFHVFVTLITLEIYDVLNIALLRFLLFCVMPVSAHSSEIGNFIFRKIYMFSFFPLAKVSEAEQSRAKPSKVSRSGQNK